MRFLDCTPGTVAENLALDEALLLRGEESGQECLRLWETLAPAVVLGAGCSLAADVDEAACVADNVPILRRSTGGGTVLLGHGCLLFSLVLAFERAPELAHIGSSYRYILEKICCALDVADLRLAGISDLAVGSRKVSGNAQQRKRTHLLHHGSLLYAYDVNLVARYLRMPARQPAYRQERPHGEFLANLPLRRDDLASRLRQAFGAEETEENCPMESVVQLVKAKYARQEWTRRR